MRAPCPCWCVLGSLLLGADAVAQQPAPSNLSPPTPQAIAPPQVGDAGKWYPRAPLRTARQETGGARIGDKIYVVGGLRSTPLGGMRALRSVEVYDIAQDSWSFAAPMPDRRDHMVVASHAGKLYVMGGFKADFLGRSNFWVYDPVQDAWSSLSNLPEPRGAGWAVVHDDKIYHLGGSDETGLRKSSTFIYSIEEGKWSEGAPMPIACLHLTAAVVGDHIYAIGGRRHNLILSAPFAFNHRYDPQLDEWTALAPMPTPRSAMGIAVVDGRIHVCGGEWPSLHDAHEVYDPGTDTWSILAPMAVPRHAPAPVALGDGFLVAGGGTSLGLAETAHVDLYLPRSHFAGACEVPGLRWPPLPGAPLLLPAVWPGFLSRLLPLRGRGGFGAGEARTL